MTGAARFHVADQHSDSNLTNNNSTRPSNVPRTQSQIQAQDISEPLSSYPRSLPRHACVSSKNQQQEIPSQRLQAVQQEWRRSISQSSNQTSPVYHRQSRDNPNSDHTSQPSDELETNSSTSPTPPHNFTVPRPGHPDLSRLQIAQAEWAKLIHHNNTQHQHSLHTRPTALSMENLQTNLPWGDALTAKDSHITRIYALNLNGLSLDRRGGQFDTLCSVAKEVQADIVCCQEHNVDTSQQTVRSILYHTVQQHWKRAKVQFASTITSFANFYKPGGTLMLAVGNITGRIIAQSSDPMGRWVTQTLRGNRGQKLTIISAYQVVTDSPHVGLNTATSQQRSALIQAQDPIREPRKAFKRDLRLLLTQCTNRGDHILLVGDFNEDITSAASGMGQIAADFQLVDLMRTRSQAAPPATYSRGRSRLDFGLATPHVAAALISGGYEEFNARYPTDHRSYFFDFDTEELFGSATQPLAPAAVRMLRSNNTVQVTKYIREKYEQLERCEAFARGRHLQSHVGNCHHFAERLDNDVVAASLSAEKKVQNHHLPAWSIALARARERVVVLQKCLSMIRNNRTVVHLIQPAIERGILSDIIPLTTADCTSQLRAAKLEVQQLVKVSYAKREEEQKRRIEELETSASRADQKQATIIRRIKRAEALKRLFEKISYARTKNIRQGVTRIEIPKHPNEDPKNCTDWEVIDVPSQIVQHLQARNQRHFGQADGTPFTVHPLTTDFGFVGDREAGDQVLVGDYQIPDCLDESTKMLLEHLQQTKEMANFQGTDDISAEDFCAKLKVWTESTTTSPSGLHLGHYKTLIARHAYSHIEDDDTSEEEGTLKVTLRDDLNHMQQSLLDLHLQLINYATCRGYSYTRWQTIANTILFKEPNNIKIHRTRVIHIYEADYNLILGVKWRQALYTAEAVKQLNKGQFGSRPRRNAIDPVALEELQFEMSRLTRKSLVQLNFDATACYDRIIPNLAMVASRRFGVHKQVTALNAKTLQQARYHIRTDMGLSESSYSHQDHMPIYGTGQGSANSPMIWCFISSLLFDCYDNQAFEAMYTNPDRSAPLQWTMVGFVDDSNGQVNSFLCKESKDLQMQLRRKAIWNATEWSKLLSATGGAIELPKCSYHFLAWKFSVGGAPVLADCESELQELPVIDPLTGCTQNLEYLSPHRAHKTLGHYKEPAGTQRTQFEQLREKSDSITDFLWSTNLSRDEAWLYYTACYLPAVTYPLTCSYLQMAQLSKIQRKAMSIIVSRCGYNRKTKKEILFGHPHYGGAGFHHLYYRQSTQQILYFLRHWRLNSPIGQLLKCVLAWAQFTTGVSYPILEVTNECLPHLETKWITSIRDFLRSIDGGVMVDTPGIPQPQRASDKHLMDMIIASNSFTKAEIRSINYCRLHLQAVTLSDITVSLGTKLDNSKLQGSPSLQSSHTQWVQVNQDKPSPREWRLWKRANRLWADQDGLLHNPLGEWTVPIHAQRFQHFAYRSRRHLWIREDDGQFFTQHRLQRTVFRSDSQSNTNPPAVRAFRNIPKHAVPVEAEYDESLQWVQVGQPVMTDFISTAPRPTADITFAAYIETLETWEIDLLRHVTMGVDPNLLCLETQQEFLAVSDGSVLPSASASFGWIFSTSRGERLAHAYGPVRSREVHSYRAEASGILSLLRFLIRIAEFTQQSFEPWKGVIATDGQSLLDTLAGSENVRRRRQGEPVDLDYNRVVLDVLCPEWDVLIEIQRSLRQLPGVRLEFVPSHQDDQIPYAQLPLMAQLNVDADRLAASYHTDFGGVKPMTILSPNARAHLLLKEGTVTSRYDEAISLETTAPPLVNYMRRKYGWTLADTEAINWKAHARALRKQKSRRAQMVKLVHNILPSHSQLNKFDGGKRRCPLCQSQQEDQAHILRCPHPSRELWRQSFINEIAKYCDTSGTYPPMQALLCDTLRRWLRGDLVEPLIADPDMIYPEDMRQLIGQQQRLGWEQLIAGRFGYEWSALQKRYAAGELQALAGDHARNQTFDVEKWQVGLITTIWENWRIVWTQRNKDVHGHDMTTKNRAERIELRRRLHDVYSKRHLMEPAVQTLLMNDVETHQEMPSHVTKNWLMTNASIFSESVRRVQKFALRGVQSITAYFPVRGNSAG